MNNKTSFFPLNNGSDQIDPELELFKKGNKDALSILCYYYFLFVEKTFKKEFKNPIIEQFKQALTSRVFARQNEIDYPNQVQRLFFQEVIIICSAQGDSNKIPRIQKELNAIQNILFRIQEIPIEERLIIKKKLLSNGILNFPEPSSLSKEQRNAVIQKFNDSFASAIIESKEKGEIKEEKADLLLDIFQDRFIPLLKSIDDAQS